MRITSKGQVTIPIEIREKLGLLAGCRQPDRDGSLMGKPTSLDTSPATIMARLEVLCRAMAGSAPPANDSGMAGDRG